MRRSGAPRSPVARRAAAAAQRARAPVAGGGTQARSRSAIRSSRPRASEFEAAMRAMRLGGPEASETARGAVQRRAQDRQLDLGGLVRPRRDRVERRRRRRGDRRLRQGARDQPGPHPVAAGARRGATAARATRRRRAPTTRPRSRAWTRTIRTAATPPRGWRRCCATPGTSTTRSRCCATPCGRSGANAKIYTELGQIYLAQKRLELAQLVLAQGARARREGSRDLQRARDARAAPGQGPGGVRAVRSGGVARRQLHRRAVQQGVGAARRRRLRASQGRARGDRRKETGRLRRAGRARRRRSRAQGVPGGKEDHGSG